jgi:biotin synthase-like enzyme
MSGMCRPGPAGGQRAGCVMISAWRTERATLAHLIRRRWCGDAVEVEGIVSVKTGGGPEDRHFC